MVVVVVVVVVAATSRFYRTPHPEEEHNAHHAPQRHDAPNDAAHHGNDLPDPVHRLGELRKRLLVPEAFSKWAKRRMVESCLWNCESGQYKSLARRTVDSKSLVPKLPERGK